MSNVQELLAKVTKLKQDAVSYSEKLQDAKTREALISDQLDKLGAKLSELAGDVEWADLGEVIIRAAEEAQGALEALAAALDEAGVEYE